MHDWILRSAAMDWSSGQLTLSLSAGGTPTLLIAHDVRDLRIPKAQPWGQSDYVNRTDGPTKAEGGYLQLCIEMQSGDQIEIVAKSFDLPENHKWHDPSALPLG